MASNLPPLAWIRAFEAAARHLSFTRAAEELNVSQSAISQNIRALEQKLGQGLFYRKARAIELTPAGRNILPEISTGLTSIHAAVDHLVAGKADDVITIASSLSFARWFLAPHINDFRQLYPDIRLNLVTSIWPDEFINSRADIEIRFGSEKQVGKNAERLLPDHLILVASKSLTSSKPKIDWARIAEMPYIEVQGTANKWQDWVRHSGMKVDFRPVLFVDHYGLAIELMKSGQFVALVSSLIAAPALDAGWIEVISDYRQTSSDGYFLAQISPTKRGKSQIVADWIKSLISE